MLQELVQKLRMLTKDQRTVDPSQFNDPVALKADWSPVKRGGTNFQTRKLVKVNPYRLEFRATGFAIFIYSLFSVSGVGLLIGCSVSKYQSNQLPFGINIILLIAGLIFTVLGSVMLYSGTSPVVFDKTKSFFWKGRKTPEHGLDSKTSTHVARLNDIHAFQLISEYCSGKNPYYSYELNIVLKDGTRINVVDHGNKTKLKHDALSLSAFFNKPLWDAIPL